MNFKQFMIITIIVAVTAPTTWGADDEAFEDDATQTKPSVKTTSPSKAPKATTSPAATKATPAKATAKSKPTTKEQQNIGSGKIISSERQLPGFSGLYVSGNFNIQLKIGEIQQVKITGDDNLLSAIKTSVEGGRLDIAYLREVRQTVTITITITSPHDSRHLAR